MKILLSITLFLMMLSCSHSQGDSVATKGGATTSEGTTQPWPEAFKNLSVDTKIARNPRYRFQMVYTPIDTAGIGETISYGTDQYYYPASLVKIPLALLTLEYLEEKEIPLSAFPVFDTVDACGSVRFVEVSRNKISFEQMFKELIVVSDNQFYNMLYHFLTPEYINRRLHELGFTGSHIYRAFTGCKRVEQLHTYPFTIYGKNGEVLMKSSGSTLDSTQLYQHYTETDARKFGSQHENSEGDIVPGPFDLNFSIELPLNELHEMFLRLYAVEAFPEEKRWRISDEHRRMLLGFMKMYPSEIQSAYRSYRGTEDTIYKYAHLKTPSGKRMRTVSKLGLSYGFASEVAYIQNPLEQQAFILTYSIYVNANDIVNDGKYEYEEVARPFAAQLAKALAEFQKTNR